MKNKLYCVCKDAGIDTCKKCAKRKRINPDHTLNYPYWKRKDKDQKITNK